MARCLDPGVEIRLDVGHAEEDGSLIESLAGRIYCFFDAGSWTAGAGAEVDDRVGCRVDVGDVIEDALE